MCNSVEKARQAFKEVRIKQGTQSWITTEILLLCSERDKTLIKFKHARLEFWYNMHLHFCN